MVVLPHLAHALVPLEPALGGVVEGVGGEVGGDEGGRRDAGHGAELGSLAAWPSCRQLVGRQLPGRGVAVEGQDGGQRVQGLVQEVLNRG